MSLLCALSSSLPQVRLGCGSDQLNYGNENQAPASGGTTAWKDLATNLECSLLTSTWRTDVFVL